MTIPYCIQFGEKVTSDQIKRVNQIIEKTFLEIDQIYNNWNPNSEISKLNQAEANQKIALSSQLESFLHQVDQMVIFTEGRFDPTVASLHQLWKKSLQMGNLPHQEEIEQASIGVGWHLIHIENHFFWKEYSQTALDLCGMSKGYAVDLLTERLEKIGIQNFYVEWGGEIRTIGHHLKKRPWKVAIFAPHQNHPVLKLTHQALATSGSYIQSWQIHDIQYTHLFDPKTCQPLSNPPIQSVTVLAQTCAEADACATALMLFPTLQEALQWASARQLKAFIW